MSSPFRHSRRLGVDRPHLVRTHAHRPRIRATWALARITLGLLFLWSFFDKLLGLGFATPREGAWLRGGSPTSLYLRAVEGPFAGLFHPMAGSVFVDVLFMIGLLGIGAALTLGIGVRVAAATGATLLLLMWLASFPIEEHPFIDRHLVYAIVFVGLALDKAGHTFGFGERWVHLPVVQRHPWLE